jgi:hypothetical protein
MEQKHIPPQLLSFEHQQDLMDSGLSVATIERAGILTISKNFHVALGFPVKHLIGMYRIPYPKADGFCRFRCFYSMQQDKRPPYMQRKKCPNRLYMPSFAQEHFANVQTPLYIVDEEIKALKACQEELHCIATPGIWGWSSGRGRLVDDFNLITFNERKVYLVPDSNWQAPENNDGSNTHVFAVERLAEKLLERGAQVFIKHLPPREDSDND